MPRLLGVDIPNDKPTFISLTYLSRRCFGKKERKGQKTLPAFPVTESGRCDAPMSSRIPPGFSARGVG